MLTIYSRVFIDGPSAQLQMDRWGVRRLAVKGGKVTTTYVLWLGSRGTQLWGPGGTPAPNHEDGRLLPRRPLF